MIFYYKKIMFVNKTTAITTPYFKDILRIKSFILYRQ